MFEFEGAEGGERRRPELQAACEHVLEEAVRQRLCHAHPLRMHQPERQIPEDAALDHAGLQHCGQEGPQAGALRGGVRGPQPPRVPDIPGVTIRVGL